MLQFLPGKPINVQGQKVCHATNTNIQEFDLQVGLGIKLLGYVMAGVLITSAAIGVVRVQNERGPLSELIDKSGQSVANATASGAASLVAGYDYGNLEILAANVARQANVIRVTIRNQNDRVMAQASGEAGGAHKRFESPVVFDGQTIGGTIVDVSTDALENALNDLYWRVFIEQLVFGAIVGLIVYFFTASGIVSPIRKLTTAMEEAVEKGDSFVARDLEVKSRDEIGRLVSVFNTLNKSLADYHRQLHSKIDLANQELRDKNLQLGGRTLELENALDLLSTMASTDWLTELPNRRKFDETLSRMFHQSERFAEEITLVLFDIDHFKLINDSHGHGAGDEVLRDIGTLLRLHVRKSDVPARLGGDEFGIVLYHTNTEQAELFVEILMEGVRAHAFNYDGFQLNIGLSIGIAQYDASMSTPQELYYAADKALYQAKHGGRGRYCVYAEATRSQENAST
jgi:diguanylate cyclase (GGDEF)-like protein